MKIVLAILLICYGFVLANKTEDCNPYLAVNLWDGSFAVIGVAPGLCSQSDVSQREKCLFQYLDAWSKFKKPYEKMVHVCNSLGNSGNYQVGLLVETQYIGLISRIIDKLKSQGEQRFQLVVRDLNRDSH